MSTSTRVTLAQYDEMIRQGLFEPREEHHVELICGEIVPMSPINDPHAWAVDLMTAWSFDVAPRGEVWLRVQGPVGIPELDSVPEPDIVWLRRLDYSKRRPLPEDVLLIIEVADSSLARDRGIKARLYAEAGIAEYWILNMIDRQVEVLRQPSGNRYESVEIFSPPERVSPLAFPHASLDVVRLFPATDEESRA